MTDKYTPTTDEVMSNFNAPLYRIDPQREGETFSEYIGRLSMSTMEQQMKSEAAARRWLTVHDREVAARVLREAVRERERINAAEGRWNFPAEMDWYRKRADAIESGEL